MKKMNSISSARYSDNVESLPFVNRIINSIVYACCAYNGFFMSKRITKINCVNIVLILVQTIVTNTKATLIFGLAFLFAGYFVGMQYFDIKINIKKIIHIVIAIIFFLIFSVVINYLRHAGTLSLFEEFKKILVSYFIGPFSAFSAWFSKSNFKSLDLGANTFSCIFRLLGIQSQAHGEFVIINNEATNVYTIFKHLINDYSVLGTLIISNLLGLISFICDSKVINKKYNFIGMSIIIDATILLSFFSSIFRYTTNILASILILIFALPVKYGGLKNEK